jgi:hypothetical protein
MPDKRKESMMYDRILRAALSESNRFVELHNDSHRLLFVALIWRANDFGCLECDTRAMSRWVGQFTQIKTPEALLAALSALADCDLIRRYESDNKTYLFIPRFRSARSYTTRGGIPASPWCQSTAPTGRIRSGTKRYLAAQTTQSVQVKPSTNQIPAPPLAQPVANSPQNQQVIDSKQLALESCANPALPLTRGVGEVQEKKKKAMRLPDGWTIPAPWVDWAITFAASAGFALSAEQVGTIADSFADHWHSIGGPNASRVDWLATWRNWIRRQDLRKVAKSVDNDLNRWT